MLLVRTIEPILVQYGTMNGSDTRIFGRSELRRALLVRLFSDPTLFARGESLSTRFPIKVARLATDVRLGDITLDQPWVEINAAFPLANFGSCPLQHFIVTFDQENKLIRLDGPHKRITLGVTPAPLRLTNQPGNPMQVALVPVG